MLALIAVICFAIALVVPTIGPINMVTLGLCFVAAHLLFGIGVPWRRTPG